MNVTKITIGRLFNCGNFEHCRYEIAVELKEGDSAEKAIIGLEKIIDALKPEHQAHVSTKHDLDREADRLLELQSHLDLPEEDFRRKHGHFDGSPHEYFDRCEKIYLENLEKRRAYQKRAERARQLLDDLGGAAEWKDAKLEWEDYEC